MPIRIDAEVQTEDIRLRSAASAMCHKCKKDAEDELSKTEQKFFVRKKKLDRSETDFCGTN